MSNNTKNILFFTLLIAILIFFSSKFNTCNEPSGNTGQLKADTVYTDTGTTVHTDTFYSVKVKWKDSIEYVYVEGPIQRPEPTDTPGIIKHHYSTFVFDSTYDVQYGTLRLIDTLTENRILARRFDLKQSIPEITITKTLPPKRVTFGAQVGAGLMYNGKVHAGLYAGVGVNIRLSKN